jgi:hypothetical protein
MISNISFIFVGTSLKLKGWEPKYEDVINYKKKNREEQKKQLIEMMHADEDLRLYDSMRSFTTVLDTMIYPVIIRYLLFWCAYYDIYMPKWSKHIFDEWKDVMQGKGVSPVESEKRKLYANLAFPDALVTHYETLIEHQDLPDEKDRHVLAEAIKANAHVIVSNNIKKDNLSR